jgi:hypothetical protein
MKSQPNLQAMKRVMQVNLVASDHDDGRKISSP